MKRNTLLIGASTAVLSLTALPSQAATFLWSYTATSGTIAFASGTFTTSDTVNGVGGYDVTGVTGQVDGDVLTGMIANPNQPNTATSPLGLFYYDNNFFAGAPSFTTAGLLFTSGGGVEYNLWADNASTYQLWRGAPGQGWTNTSVGTFAVQAAGVPEPAIWAFMIAGFGMIGAVLRQRRAAMTVA